MFEFCVQKRTRACAFTHVKIRMYPHSLFNLNTVICHKSTFRVKQQANLPPAKDWARTSAVKAVFVLLTPLLCRSSARCSPSTFLHLPYRKLCRMSEVITSESARLGHLNPDLRAKVSAGSTEPIMQRGDAGRSEDGEQVDTRAQSCCSSVRPPAPKLCA